MRGMRSMMAGVLGAGAVVAGASAQLNTEFTQWGSNAYGQCNVPTGVQFASIAEGNLHSLGLTANAQVVAWGSNETGQCDVPIGVSDVVQVSAGGWYQNFDQRGHSVALLRNGTVLAWGSNEFGQCDVPAGLFNIRQVACGWAHTAALTASGQVIVWGAGLTSTGSDPNWGQRVVPTNLGNVSAIATRGCHIMARLADGTVRCWGRNAEGQCDTPTKLGVVRQIAAGSDHSVVLTESGVVRCWGWNYYHQSDVPQNLGTVREVAASMYGTIALREDGQVVTWGLIDPPPTTLAAVEHVTAGGYHATALGPRDCNGNGIRDSLEIETARAFDSDGDSLLDACDSGVVMPVISDIVMTRGTQSPVLPWPVCSAWDTRTQTGGHLWDLWVSRASTEGPWLNRSDAPSGNPFKLDAVLVEGMNVLYCRMDNNYCTDPFFTANLWFGTEAQPTVSGTNGSPIEAFSGVIPGLIPGAGVPAAGALAARVGAWDVQLTDLTVSAAADLVGPISFARSGAPDVAATISISVIRACAADIDRNNLVNGIDLAIILSKWGTNGGADYPGADIDRSGIVDGGDLAQVLNSWGPCQ